MTGRALQLVMRAQQGKAVRNSGMGKIGIIPVFGVVTVETSRRKTAPRMFVLIIGLMAGKAIILIRRLK